MFGPIKFINPSNPINILNKNKPHELLYLDSNSHLVYAGAKVAQNRAPEKNRRKLMLPAIATVNNMDGMLSGGHIGK